MKKLVFGFIFLLFVVVSCGPSAKELETQRVTDSIYMADSIALLSDTTIVDTIQVDSVQIDTAIIGE